LPVQKDLLTFSNAIIGLLSDCASDYQARVPGLSRVRGYN
jgi:hypothetical protein